MSSGTLLFGLLNGLIIGLLAVGLVLVYKSNRFLNLAHGQMGALSALILAKCVLDWGWNWWIAFFLAVVVGLATAIAVERLLVGPLRRKTSSPVRLVLLTIGISQVLLAFTYIPRLGPDQKRPRGYPQPFTSHLEVGHVVLTGTAVLTVILVPLLVAGLALFLRYSSLGKQMRAAASNPDAARLCGVSVDRVSTLCWALAGVFAAVSAVLQAPNNASFNVAALGPYLLMLTLGAAAFGAFVSIPGALAGGLVLGMIGQVVSAQTSSGAKSELAVFAAILLVILVRGRAISRVFAVTGAAVEERPVTRIPAALQASPLVRRQPWWLAGGALTVAVLVPLLPYFRTEGHRFQLTLVLIFALLGVSVTMLLGWGGQVSLGHFAVVGLGAYLTAHLAPHGLTLLALFVIAGLVGAGVLVLVGLPALRVPGLTLAVTTLGFAVVANDWLFHQPWVGSSQAFGVPITPPPLGAGLGRPTAALDIYYVALAVLALAIAAGGALRRSTPGRLIIAVRDNERASAAFGVTPATIKLAILAVSGFFAGVAGVLWADAWKSATLAHFTPDVSIAAIAVPVVGGMGSLAGAAAGAVALYIPTFFVGPLVAPLFGTFGRNLGFQLFLAGVGQVAVLLQAPTGLAGAAQRWWQALLDRRAQRVVAARAEQEPEVPLRTEGVRVRFGGIVALDGPVITVGPGEIVGLIGPNGAGKTTLMNAVSGVVPASTGSVRLFGHEVIDLPPDFRAGMGVARSFQDATLFAGLTVTETIQVALARRHRIGFMASILQAPWARLTEQETRLRAEDIVTRLGLTAYADVRPPELSTGTRRICDLAAQVATGSKLLLLDEPTAGVAQRDAEAFGPLLRRIRDELDCSILLVEHDMPLLMGLCDRIYAMESGRVIAVGSPEEIRNDPTVIASYLGTEEVAIGRSGRAVATTVRERRSP